MTQRRTGARHAECNRSSTTCHHVAFEHRVSDTCVNRPEYIWWYLSEATEFVFYRALKYIAWHELDAGLPRTNRCGCCWRGEATHLVLAHHAVLQRPTVLALGGAATLLQKAVHLLRLVGKAVAALIHMNLQLADDLHNVPWNDADRCSNVTD